MARIPYNNEVQGTLNAQSLPQQSSGVTKEMVSAETGFGELIGVAAKKVQEFAIERQGKLDLEEYESTNAAYKTWESERKINAYGQKLHQAKNIFASEKQVMDDWTNGDGSASHLAFKEKYEAMNDRQKLRMATAITVRQPDYLNAVGMHQSKQTDLAVIDSSKASLGAAFTSYAAAATDQESARELRSIDSSVEAIGVVNGWTSERIEQEKVVQRSTAHESRIAVMLSREGADPNSNVVDEVQKYIKAFDGELTKATLVTVNKAVREKSITDGGFKHALAALGTDDPNGYLRDNKELSNDPKMQAAAIQNVYRLQSLDGRQKEATRKKHQDTIYNQIWIDRRDETGLDQAALMALPAKDREVFRKMITARDTKWPVVSKRDNAIALGTLLKFKEDNPKNFANYRLAQEYWGRLDESTFNAMVNLQTKTKEGLKTASSSSIGSLITSKGATMTFGITGTAKSAQDGHFRGDAEDLLGRMTTNLGKVPSREDFKVELDKMVDSKYRSMLKAAYPMARDASNDPSDSRTPTKMLNAAFGVAVNLDSGKVDPLRAKNDKDKARMAAVENGLNAWIGYSINKETNPHKIPPGNDAIQAKITSLMADKVFLPSTTFGYRTGKDATLASQVGSKPGAFVVVKGADGEDIEILTALIDSLPTEVKNAIGKDLTDNVITYQNKAEAYMRINPTGAAALKSAKKKPPPGPDLDKNGNIPNPTGGDTISPEKLAEMVRDPDVSAAVLENDREYIKNAYGKITFALYMELIRRRKYAEAQREELPEEDEEGNIPSFEGGGSL